MSSAVAYRWFSLICSNMVASFIISLPLMCPTTRATTHTDPLRFKESRALTSTSSSFVPCALLIWLGWIIPKKLSHSLLQVPVVLIRVFLKVNGLGGIPAPDELLCCGVIQVYEQPTGGYGRSLARHGSAVESAPTAAPSPRVAAGAEGIQVDAFLLTKDGMVADLKVPVFFDPGKTFLCELFVHCALNVLVDQLIRHRAAGPRQVDPLVGLVAGKMCVAVIVVMNILAVSARDHKKKSRQEGQPFRESHCNSSLL